MSLRVVFDTNVLFSAIGWAGKPGACVQLAVDGRIAGLTCVEILEELSEKLLMKLALGDDQVAAVLGSLLATFEVVSIGGAITGVQPDPKDDKIIECAVNGKATHVVTGNFKHLLPMRRFKDIEIITPTELVGIVGMTPPK